MMNASVQSKMQRVSVYLAALAAVSVLCSIAASQILLGAAIVSILLSGNARLPAIWVPAGLFMLGTLIALALSEDPWTGRFQIRKFYVWLTLLVVYSALRTGQLVVRLIWFWGALAALNATWAIHQYLAKLSAARALHVDFYSYYLGQRITGFQSHWMTFSGLEMLALLMLTSSLLFLNKQRWTLAAVAAGLIILIGILLGDTRSVWGATVAGLCYLIAVRKPALLLLAPPLLAVVFFAAPAHVQQRILSIYRPHGTMDSNEHRYVTRVTGIEMIKAHPWFGLGPDMVDHDFNQYVPAYVHRPLPTGYYGHLHNIYLQYAADRGIPTMLALMAVILLATVQFARGLRSLPSEERAGRAVLHGAIAAVIAMLVEGFFEVNLGDSEPLELFLAILACGYVALDLVRQEKARTEDRLLVTVP